MELAPVAVVEIGTERHTPAGADEVGLAATIVGWSTFRGFALSGQ